MNPYTTRKIVEFAASLMILVPCVLLLAWESLLPNVTFLWFILPVCSGMFLTALFHAERRKGAVTWKRLLSRCGGFFMMFFFILYQTVSLLS